MKRIEDLKLAWNAVCSAYLARLAENWEWNVKSYGWWVGDEIGGMYAYGDNTFISMDDIRYCVDYSVEWWQYEEWTEYCRRVIALRHEERHDPRWSVPNLRAWYEGCPRMTEEELAHHEEIDRLADEALKRHGLMTEDGQLDAPDIEN